MTYLQARRVQGFGQEARNGERRRCGGGMKGCAGESSGRACFRNGGMWRSAAAIFGWARRRGDVFRTRLVAGPRLGLLSTSLEIRCWAVGGRLPGSLWRAVAVGEVHGEWNISHVVFRRIGPVGGRVSRVLILPPAAWCSFMVVLLLLLLLLLYLQRRLLLLLRWLLHHAGRGRQRDREREEENSERVSSNGKDACASGMSKGKSCLVRSDARIRVQVKLRGSRLVGLTSRSAQAADVVEELYVTSIGDSWSGGCAAAAEEAGAVVGVEIRLLEWKMLEEESVLGISILFFWVRGWGKGAEGKRSMLTPRYRRSSSHKSQKAAALSPRRGPRRTRERRYTGTTVVPASSQSQRTGRAQEARLGNQRVTCGRGVSLIGFGRNQLISSAVPIGHTQ